jgi:hypothetical protein
MFETYTLALLPIYNLPDFGKKGLEELFRLRSAQFSANQNQLYFGTHPNTEILHREVQET